MNFVLRFLYTFIIYLYCSTYVKVDLFVHSLWEIASVPITIDHPIFPFSSIPFFLK